ncbi:glutaredoxin domain-containing protein [Conexibacter sp. SYSU D00693]|uniref:glutaredoxin family protein n=1 Tax=Conexibacter sp. SYSU D00693 TaxID=2812560 RepID=UPI00196A8B37|nr:glutaredoxin domain-containing protein [Conexibacter sp. SYSU D00693]
MDTAKITVYSTDACPYCIRAKQLLDARGYAYEEINLARDPDGRAELVAKTGMMTFPQVLVGEELIGGFTETVQADRSGRLAQLLQAAA